MITEKFKRIALDRAINFLGEKEDEDFVSINVGGEGKGKTDLSIQMCLHIDPNYSGENIVASAKDFIPKVEDLPRGSVVHVIEGAKVFYVRDSSCKLQKENVRFLTTCRNPYHKFIQIDIPNLFLLDWYVRAHRARSLTYCVKKGWFWSYKKSMIKQIWQEPKSRKIHWPKPSFRDKWTKCKGHERELYDLAEKMKAESWKKEREEEKTSGRTRGITQEQVCLKEFNAGKTPDYIVEQWGFKLQVVRNYFSQFRKQVGFNNNKNASVTTREIKDKTKNKNNKNKKSVSFKMKPEDFE